RHPTRRSYSLRRPAFELADDDHRIDHAADIVDRPVAIDLDGAGLRIDFDFADVRSVGPCRIGNRARRIEHDALLRLFLREVEEAHGPVRSRDAEHAVTVLDVANGGFKFAPGELLRP